MYGGGCRIHIAGFRRSCMLLMHHKQADLPLPSIRLNTNDSYYENIFNTSHILPENRMVYTLKYLNLKVSEKKLKMLYQTLGINTGEE